MQNQATLYNNNNYYAGPMFCYREDSLSDVKPQRNCKYILNRGGVLLVSPAQALLWEREVAKISAINSSCYLLSNGLKTCPSTTIEG